MESNQSNELDPRIQVYIHKYLLFCEIKSGTYVINGPSEDFFFDSLRTFLIDSILNLIFIWIDWTGEFEYSYRGNKQTGNRARGTNFVFITYDILFIKETVKFNLKNI